MTPMIDVVFLLIIFFLVSSHLARQENRLPLELPAASSFVQADPDKGAITISLDDAAAIRIQGSKVSLDRMKEILAEKSNSQSLAIRIRVDGKLQYRYVEPVLREAALAGVTDASIAVIQK